MNLSVVGKGMQQALGVSASTLGKAGAVRGFSPTSSSQRVPTCAHAAHFPLA